LFNITERHSLKKFCLEAEHLRPEPDLDGFNGTVEAARAAVPAFIRILHVGNISNPVKMDDIHRAVEVT
jgi:hypothetical protein